MNAFEILNRHYDPSTPLYHVLVVHSTLVTRKAMAMARDYLSRSPAETLDLEFLTEAALLHDIGVKFCHAPNIHCTGSEPYIRHGILGKQLLEAEGLPRHGLVCVRHTGSGISQAEVRERQLPLPEDDYLPVSIEEKIICVADKYYSKNPARLWEKKKRKSIFKSIRKYGPASLDRLEGLFEEILGLTFR
jgi:uncharacterized protein